jgi:hypothetical protein
MATIKSYTDIEQSKKLAEILPLESADMFLAMDGIVPVMSKYIDDGLVTADETAIPCWSLAALLEQLKAEIQLENKQILFLHINKYDDINYDIRYTNSWTGEVFITEADNLVDACVAMIEKLHELKLLRS